LPYGKWTCADGREVLFNRDYLPLWQRWPGQEATRANLYEWVPFVAQEWFYNDGNPPWRVAETRARCRAVLHEFLNPQLAQAVRKPQLPPALLPLQFARRWLLWKWERRNGTWTKPPIDGHGHKIDPTNATNWLTFEQACALAPTGPLAGGRPEGGIGFALEGSGIAALDLDDCRDLFMGVIEDWALELILQAGSYTEITPSEEGLRILGYGDGAPVHAKIGRLELYRDARRFITISGMQFGDAGLCNIDAVIDARCPPAVTPVKLEHKISPLSVRKILRKHGIDGLLWFSPYEEPEIGLRSDRHWWQTCCLRERGVPAHEAFVLLKASPWNKHAEEERCDRMVWTMIEKAWALPFTPWPGRKKK
jgi:hypothetical protein